MADNVFVYDHSTEDTGAAPEWPPCPDLTVDLVVITRESEPHVLLIKRGDPPFLGFHALPGGYTNAGEKLTDSVRREAFEETGLEVGAVVGVDVYDDPARDPRGHVISIAYLTTLPSRQPVRAGDDAAAAQWIPLHQVLDKDVPTAFDHRTIVHDAAHKLGVLPV